MAPRTYYQLTQEHNDVFVDDLIAELLAQPGPYSELRFAQKVLGLTDTDTAALFDIRRQALAAWKTNGVPSKRMPQVASLASTARLLHRALRPAAIPAAVRCCAPNLNGASLLELGQRDGLDAMYAEVRDTFDLRRITS